MTVMVKQSEGWLNSDQKKNHDRMVEKQQVRKNTKELFQGKAFDDLNPQEKDDLLRALAIQTGLIEE